MATRCNLIFVKVPFEFLGRPRQARVLTKNMQVCSVSWLRPSDDKPPVAFVCHSDGVTALLTAPTISTAWHYESGLLEIDSAIPLFSLVGGPVLALTFSSSRHSRQADLVRQVALLKVSSRQ